MADHTSIAAVSRTLRTVLLDRMVMPASVTLVPPDVSVADVAGPRVNLYLFHVMESAELKNQEIPGRGDPGSYGRPPLSLSLRYLMTTHSAAEDHPETDLNAQALLGDAMRVMHDFGPAIYSLAISNPLAGSIGDPVLDEALANEFERVRITLQPASIDDIAKVWSSFREVNYRRSVIYDVSVVQIETKLRRVSPRPVETRRVLVVARRAPVIRAAYASAPPTSFRGENRVRIGDEITIEVENFEADKLYVRLGSLVPIRVPPVSGNVVRIALPDEAYAPDLDNPGARPIPAVDRLQLGVLDVRIEAEHVVSGVEGGTGAGTGVAPPRRLGSNVALLQLVPRIDAVIPSQGTAAAVLRLEGARLWHPRAGSAEVIVADAPISIRPPVGADPWDAPTPKAVEVPMAEAAAFLAVQAPADPPYPVAIQIDGARSRDAVGFGLRP